MPGSSGVSSTTTKNLVTITLHLLPNVVAGMQSGLKLQSADALFTSDQYIDEAGGLILESSTLTVGFLTTTMTATPVTATAGTATTLTSTLKDTTGNPLSGMNVDYYIGSQKVGTAKTDASGISSLQYTPNTAGTYTIKASYVGNQEGGKFASSEITATLTVNSPNTQPTPTIPTSTSSPTPTPVVSTPTPNSQITPAPTNPPQQNKASTVLILSVPVSAIPNQQMWISSKLKDSNQQPISDATVDYNVVASGTNQPIGNAKTDSSGSSSIPFTPTQAGTYEIQAKFEGNTAYSSSSASKTLTVSSDGITNTLDLRLSNKETNTQTFVTLSATLKDAGGSPLDQENIVFQYTLDGISWNNITTVTTASDGVAQTNYKPSTIGSMTIRAFFSGVENYLAQASNEEILSVNDNTQNAFASGNLIAVIAIVVVVIAVLIIVLGLRKRNSSRKNKSRQ